MSSEGIYSVSYKIGTRRVITTGLDFDEATDMVSDAQDQGATDVSMTRTDSFDDD